MKKSVDYNRIKNVLINKYLNSIVYICYWWIAQKNGKIKIDYKINDKKQLEANG